MPDDGGLWCLYLFISLPSFWTSNRVAIIWDAMMRVWRHCDVFPWFKVWSCSGVDKKWTDLAPGIYIYIYYLNCKYIRNRLLSRSHFCQRVCVYLLLTNKMAPEVPQFLWQNWRKISCFWFVTGGNVSASQLRDYTGTYIGSKPGPYDFFYDKTRVPPYFAWLVAISSGPNMFVDFVTDGSDTRTGYTLSLNLRPASMYINFLWFGF